ncbi:MULTISPECIES: hypothetical protein [unclassified Paenibacillus]|uniref:hypothetical protein n=1 Tax=unclassified Paenibacillus TaxID=185978 RepID=UPI002406F99F|nr:MULTISPECIES: hypothetical protein [unclassified Paenibacillus]MDF9845201.1 hypothetical protein [Paenibacillus sp. PastF-2]MDF9850307.1 hypothetical protein [Paenibacillus sp. PastM-2]MDF9856990.1 hypothetical protein [Paenibacillus sp. PastF-1]MDH6482153.1 hypothetical protein [Paenibacillus sp. PastH-2]MDH6509683.1 hypothetical protein [Paenibacillus sp. PastM-3]
MSQMERELSWEDEIEKDGGEFTLLPAGDYNFTVTKFERGRFSGSEKMPACNQAKLELTVHSPEHGDVVIFHNLFLHTKTEGLLSNFFAGIGQKRKGEKLRMNWQTVIGSKGRLKLEVNNFRGRDGADKTNNQVKSFYAADELPTGQPPQQQAQYNQAPPQAGQYQQQGYQQTQYQQAPPFPTTPPPQGGGWSSGQF